MAERLKRLQGRFILSINDVPESRETFMGFAFHEAVLTYSVGGGKGAAARELIVTERVGSAPTSSSIRF
jgi:DNA adenine methylase